MPESTLPQHPSLHISLSVLLPCSEVSSISQDSSAQPKRHRYCPVGLLFICLGFFVFEGAVNNLSSVCLRVGTNRCGRVCVDQAVPGYRTLLHTCRQFTLSVQLWNLSLQSSLHKSSSREAQKHDEYVGQNISCCKDTGRKGDTKLTLPWMEKQLEFNVLGSQPWLFRQGSAREVPSGGIAHSPKLKCQEKALEIIKHSVQHFLNNLRQGAGKKLSTTNKTETNSQC